MDLKEGKLYKVGGLKATFTRHDSETNTVFFKFEEPHPYCECNQLDHWAPFFPATVLPITEEI